MNVFIVSKLHIDLLVEAVFRYEVPLSVTISPDQLGSLLWEENHRSYNHRYYENELTPYYKHDSSRVHDLVTNPIYVHKQVRCYNYQSCECPDYTETFACLIMEALEDALAKSAGMNPADMIKRSDVYPLGIE